MARPNLEKLLAVKTSLPQRVLCLHCPAATRKGATISESIGPSENLGRAVLLLLQTGNTYGWVEDDIGNEKRWWTQVSLWLSRRHTLWIVGWQIHDSLQALGLADKLAAGNYQVESWTHDARSTVIQLTSPAGRVLIVDLANYCGGRLSGRAAAGPDAGAAAETFTRLAGLCVRHHIPAFRATVSGLAWSAWRASPAYRQVKPHSKGWVRKLEREAYYAGRVDCHRVGRIDGELWVCDVNALYPFCAQQWPLPVKLGSNGALALQEVDRRRALGDGCIAHCRVRSDTHAYPVRRDGHTHFALGEFNTCLAGPELYAALQRDELVSVGMGAIYQMGRPLAGFVEDWYDRRLDYSRRGEDLEATLCKQMLNSLIGRFGRRKRAWRAIPGGIPRAYWGGWQRLRAMGGVTVSERWLGGPVETEIAGDNGSRGFTALAAYVNSYGRLYMQQLISKLPTREVYYEDVDAVHCSHAAACALAAGAPGRDGRLGGIKLAGPFAGGVYCGPRNYLLGNSENGKSAGIQWRSVQCLRGDKGSPPKLSPRYAGRVGPDGWVKELWIN